MARHLERSHPVSASLPPGDRSWVDPGRKSDEVMSEIRAKYPISSQFLHNRFGGIYYGLMTPNHGYFEGSSPWV